MRPMLATQGTTSRPGPSGSHEVKWDGMRVLVGRSADGAVRVWSRNENDVTRLLPGAARARRRSRDDLLLDGEVVALGDGVSRRSGRSPTGCTSRDARSAEAAGPSATR